MKNKFETIKAAKKSFNTNAVWMKNYWTTQHKNSVAICQDKQNPSDGFFIITHPECVKYRQDKGQVVEILK